MSDEKMGSLWDWVVSAWPPVAGGTPVQREERGVGDLAEFVAALRETLDETRREMFRPYLLQHCQHPFADRWPDGHRICYQCGRWV